MSANLANTDFQSRQLDCEASRDRTHDFLRNENAIIYNSNFEFHWFKTSSFFLRRHLFSVMMDLVTDRLDTLSEPYIRKYDIQFLRWILSGEM